MKRSLKIYYDARQSSASNSSQFMNRAFEAVMSVLFESELDLQMSMTSTACFLLEGIAEGSRVALPGHEDIFVQVTDVKKRAPGELDTATLEISSGSHTLMTMMTFLKSVMHLHGRRGLREGDPRFIFDMRATSSARDKVNQYVNSTPEHVARMQRIVGAPKNITFSKHEFQSTKTFLNLCGDDVRTIRDRVRFFVNNRDWYASKGIPYQLGIMLSGDCGTGKSSAIRAIANETNRSIMNVNLAGISTCSQLKRLFLSPSVHVFETDEQTEATPMHLPVSDRIYVLDEVDALGAIVSSRSNNKDIAQQQQVPDELTLGEILNLFDGGVEVPGRIIILLSNYPERIDSALMRPGRIDVHVKFSLCTRYDIAELYSMYHDGKELENSIIATIPDRLLSPAEASDIFIRRLSSGKEGDVMGLLNDLNAAASIKT